MSPRLRGLRLLHAQLAALFSELRFPSDAKPDPTDYRGRIGEGWAAIAAHPERRFLLLIDGADEAASAWITQEVLPYEIPPNLAILLSARHKPGDADGRAWLRDFSFAPGRPCAAPLELTPLTAAAVGDAIIQLGYPLDALVERAAVLAELYRLTDRGDPLLVNLWVRQLWSERQRAARYTAADLQRLQPSFAGFLQVWREEQDKLWKAQGLTVDFDDLERLLRLLALAYAPLRIEDVLALLARLPPATTWDLVFVRTLLNGASRLVVRTGAGYAFVHSRLGDHYRAELPAHKEEREALPNAYLAWGAETVRNLNAGTFAPVQCPAYLLRHYYLDHVTAARLVPEQALEAHLLPLLGGGWHRAWLEEEGAYGGFLADLARVRQTLRQTNTARPGPPYRVAEELRISFIRTSIRAQTARLPPELIVALVQAGEWTGLRGLRVAEQLPDLQKRTQALVGLLDLLPAHLRQQGLAQALAVATAIGDEGPRADALAAVAGPLAGEPALLAEALTAATAIRSEGPRADALTAIAVAVAAHLTGEPRRQVLAEALTTATAIGDEERRAHALTAVAAHLAGEPALLARALAAATAIRSEGPRADALTAIAAHLVGEPRRQVLAEALAAATAIGGEWQRTRALAAVAAHLAGEPTLLAQALAAATAIRSEGPRARALAAVAGPLAGEPALLAEALTAATAIRSEGPRADALTAIAVAVAAHLTGEPRRQVLAEALTTATAIGDEERRAHALTAVAAHLAGEPALLARALAAATAIGDEEARAKALAAVAAHLAGERRRQVFAEALAAATAIGDEGWRAYALAAVAAHLAGEPALLTEALAATTAIGDEAARAQALVAVTAHLAGERRRQVLAEALAAAIAIGDEGWHAQVLAAVAAYLAGEPALLAETLAAATAIGDEAARARALAAVATHLAGEPALLAEALAAVTAIGDEWRRAQALVAVAAHLAGKPALLAETLAAATAIGDKAARARALVAVAAHLAGEQRRQVLAEALTAATAISYEERRAQVLAAVAAHLAGEPALLARALTAATAIDYEWPRAQALAAVAAHLAGEPALLAEALAAATAIGDEGWRAQVLAAVAAHLAGEPALLARALAAATAIGDEGWRTRALAAVAVHLAGEPALLAEALAAATAIGDEVWRANALAAVAAHLAGEQRRQVLAEAFAAFIQALDLVAERDRNALLDFTTRLLPVIRALGGPTALVGTAEAIVDTAEWWR
ncbi:hypothetical protein EV699_12021 [Plasticicumulans lactativorans]|uniref:Uncharacterized protein n=1 Tax=Plasticicumulans lactativorans TaxID=1133106 RepID=A0A4R2KZ93_9GAMM|nr:hypothetical protein [Plasticicumulans lactativorans]TCO79243.1 hypothetical protein EV699_12021 [Plasticicumulans lactativorans]